MTRSFASMLALLLGVVARVAGDDGLMTDLWRAAGVTGARRPRPRASDADSERRTGAGSWSSAAARRSGSPPSGA